VYARNGVHAGWRPLQWAGVKHVGAGFLAP
jgi:hypothetical protein